MRSNIFQHPWIKPYIKHHRKWFILVIAFGTLTMISASALMFTSGYLISKSSTQPYNILMVYVPIVLVRAFGIARPVFAYFDQLISHNFVLKILSNMRVRLYQKLETQSLTLKSRFKTGDLLGILADDLEHLQNLYLKTIFPNIVAFVLYGIIVISLGFFSIPFAFVMAIVFFILVVVVPMLSLRVNRKRQKEMKSIRNRLYEKLTDAVMGLSDWKISGRQKDFLQVYEKTEQEHDEKELKLENFQYWRDFLFQCAVALVVVLIIWFSSTQVELGTFSHLWIAAFVLAVFPVMEAFTQVPEAVTELPNYDISLNRLVQIEQSSVKDKSAEPSELQQLMAEDQFTLIMRDVDFRYSEDTEMVLQKLNLQIRQGEKLAILGKSGAGKSTIAKLLLGSISPTSGSVTINHLQTDLISRDLHKWISVLHQKPHLFNSTVLNNIRLGNIDATDEEVIEVAKKVQLHEYIESLPDGYHTNMHELGERFSGGERQRIALARILLQQTPIVILDEPTVGLDSITERKLLETIFKSLEGKTIIWITHHLIGVEWMDRVVFIENGKVKMEGSHKELLKREKRYQALYEMDRPFEIE
jgi:ATP-binding cassette subfamily C protein CydC